MWRDYVNSKGGICLNPVESKCNDENLRKIDVKIWLLVDENRNNTLRKEIISNYYLERCEMEPHPHVFLTPITFEYVYESINY